MKLYIYLIGTREGGINAHAQTLREALPIVKATKQLLWVYHDITGYPVPLREVEGEWVIGVWDSCVPVDVRWLVEEELFTNQHGLRYHVGAGDYGVTLKVDDVFDSWQEGLVVRVLYGTEEYEVPIRREGLGFAFGEWGESVPEHVVRQVMFELGRVQREWQLFFIGGDEGGLVMGKADFLEALRVPLDGAEARVLIGIAQYPIPIRQGADGWELGEWDDSVPEHVRALVTRELSS